MSLGACAGLLALLRPGLDDTGAAASPASSAPAARPEGDVPVGAAGLPGTPGCADAPVVVAAAPEIAPLVERAVRRASAVGSPGCVRYAVTAEPSGRTAARLVAGRAPVPQVWVTDSPAWPDVVNARRGTALRPEAPIATSPVRLAVPRVLADTGLPTTPRSWASIVTAADVPLALADPGTSTPSLHTLATARRVAAPPAAHATSGRVVTDARAGWSQQRLALLATSGDTTARVFPADAVQTAASAASGLPLSTIPLTDGPAPLQYELVAVPGPDAAPAAAVTALRSELGTPTTRSELRAAGFDLPRPGAGRRAPGTPSATEAVDALAVWDAARKPLRVTVAVDVSASMAQRAGDARRIDQAVAGTRRIVDTLPADADLAVWVFAQGRGAHGQAWTAAVPRRPLGVQVGQETQRAAARRALDGSARALQGGGALRDAVAAAVADAQSAWDPQRVNAVVVWTDGTADDGSRLSSSDLLAQLQQQAAGPRPVRLVVVAAGGQADGEIGRIARAARGSVVAADDPRGTDVAVLDALLGG